MRLYLDWNATAPPHPDVLEAIARAHAEGWANPASVHGPGRRALAHVEAAREEVAALLGVHPRDVVLTSGGTEANNLALRSHPTGEGGAVVVSRIEHPSVLRPAEGLAAAGREVLWVEPTPAGVIEPAAVVDALARAASPVRLVSVQAVNHETGVVQPIAAIAAALAAHAAGPAARGAGRAQLHVDAVQAVGRLPPSSWAGADLVTFAAHKIRGPKGLGAIATRPGSSVLPLLLGGSQERGFRPGTQDGAACAGLAVAARRARDGHARYAEVAVWRDAFERALVNGGDGGGAVVNGEAPRAPHVTNLSFPGWRGDELSAALDLEGIACSSGAACSAGTAEVSAVVRAMLGDGRAASAVRFSVGDEPPWDAAALAARVLAVAARAASRRL